MKRRDVDAIGAALAAKEYSDITKLREAFQKWLLIQDPHYLDVVLAAVLANRLDGDPLWLFVVAPPSSGKTEVLRSLNVLADIYHLSNLTANTFLSGQKGKRDASLLPHLDGKILVLKDFGTVLSMHRDARGEILAQLREIHDGYLSKNFGTGERKEWSGKLGLIAAVTEAIDAHRTVHSILGERFLLFRPGTEAREETALQAIHNCGNEVPMRQGLQEAVQGFMMSLGEIKRREVSIPDAITQSIVVLADLTAKGRAGVPRDGYDRTVEYIPKPEMPARLAKQLTLLGRSLAIVHGRDEVGAEELAILRRIALDTMIQQRVKVLECLWPLPSYEMIETEQVIEQTHIPGRKCREVLEDGWILHMIERNKAPDNDFGSGGKGRRPYKWRLLPEYRDDIAKVNLFEDVAPF